jgi:hypothetical protein
VAGNSAVHPNVFNMATVLEFFSGTTWIVAVAASALIAARSGVRWTTLVAGIVFAAAGALLRFPPEVSLPFSIEVALSIGWLVGTATWRDRPRLFLWVWCALGLAGLSVARGWMCARYLVILGPAAVLLSVSVIEDRWPRVAASLPARAAVLAVLTGVALLLQQADARRAVIDRDMAQTLNEWLVREAPGSAAWYPAAALAGLGFYLDQGGRWKPAEPGQMLASGDVAVVPSRTIHQRFLPAMKHPAPVARFERSAWNPARLFDFAAHAGFYGSIWSPLPFSFSRGPVEVYVVYRDFPSEEEAAKALESWAR